MGRVNTLMHDYQTEMQNLVLTIANGEHPIQVEKLISQDRRLVQQQDRIN